MAYFGVLSQLHSKNSDSTPVAENAQERIKSLVPDPSSQGERCVLRLSSFAESVLRMSREETTGAYWSQWELPGERLKASRNSRV